MRETVPDWQPRTNYVVGDIRNYNNANWECIINHTSLDIFSAGNWKPKGNSGNDTLTANDGTTIKVCDAYKVLKIVGMGTIPAGNSGVTKVGDVYYNTAANRLFECTEFTSATNFAHIAIPFVDGAVYSYNNDIYVWDGEDLVVRGAEIKTIEIDETEAEGIQIGANKYKFKDKALGEKVGNIEEVIVIDEDGNTDFTDVNHNVSLRITPSGEVDFKAFGENSENAVNALIDEKNPKSFAAIGDSITEGAGATDPSTQSWFSLLSAKLTNDYGYKKSYNFGCSGNASSGIAASVGANPLYNVNACYVPAGTDECNLVLALDMRLYNAAEKCYNCSIKNSQIDEPCLFGGIEGYVTHQAGGVNTYKFTRKTAGSAITLVSGETLIPRSVKHVVNAELMTIFVGTNDHVEDDATKIDALMQNIRRMANMSKNGKFVVLGVYIEREGAAPSNDLINAFRNEYGSKFINLYHYLSTRGVNDAVAQGLIPSGSASDWQTLLLYDGTHPNNVGHRLIYEQVLERIVELKYI